MALAAGKGIAQGEGKVPKTRSASLADAPHFNTLIRSTNTHQPTGRIRTTTVLALLSTSIGLGACATATNIATDLKDGFVVGMRQVQEPD